MTPLAACVAFAMLFVFSAPPMGSSQTPGAAVTGPVGTYKIRIDGKNAGWERFEIGKQQDVYHGTSTSQLTAQGVVQTISTTAEVRDGKPEHYSIDLKSGGGDRKYSIDFASGQANATIEYGGKLARRTVSVSDGAVLLDRNVWYQYMFLLSKYDMAAKGVQSFKVFMAHPTLREYTALVEFQETKTVKRNGQKVLANRFGVELGGGFQLLATAGEDGLPLEIEIPAEDETIHLE
ncbi:MAG TPA: hypothetical protein VJX67_22250 [Blastocatellia bacterium]|nr:hypothetical protein [Blastocatellia bacterium]